MDLTQQKEYAFEVRAAPVRSPLTPEKVSAANLRFGEGVTRVRTAPPWSTELTRTAQEVGMDFKNQNATKVGVWTDATVSKLLPMQMAIESLETAGVPYEVWDQTRVEPNQKSYVSPRVESS